VADRIVRQGGGGYAYRASTNCTWTGALETGGAALMEPGRAYYYANKSGASRTLVLAGEADTTAIGIPGMAIAAPTTTAGSYTPYSYRDPRQVNRDKLNLVGTVLHAQFWGGALGSSDRLVEQGGSYCLCTDVIPPVWSGGLAYITPGKAYYILNKHVGHAWTYTYLANGQALMAAPPTDNITTPVVPAELQKVTPKMTAPVKTAAKTRTASAAK